MRNWLFLALAFAAASLAAITPADLTRELALLKQDVAAVGALREEAAKDAAVPAGGPLDNAVLRLTLAEVVAGAPLRVDLSRRGGKWWGGRARAVDWSPLVAFVDTRKLTLDGMRMAGSVTIGLAPWTDQRNYDPSRGVATPATYALDLTVGEEGITGTAVLANPGQAPFIAVPQAVTGTVVPVAAIPPHVPAPMPKGQSTVLEQAAYYERECHALYEEARAIRAQHSGMPYAVALAEMTRQRPVREDRPITGPKAGGPVGPPGFDDDPDATAGPSPAQVQTYYGEVLDALKGMRARAQAMAALLGPRQRVNHEQVGPAGTSDPDFGPWYGAAPLPRGKGGVGALARPVIDAPQQWRYVDGWQALGPFPTGLWRLKADELPELVPIPDAGVAVDGKAFLIKHAQGPYVGPPAATWAPKPADPRTGFVTPPRWQQTRYNAKYNSEGMDWACWYGMAEFEAEAEGDVYLAIQFKDRGRLWLNDEVIWSDGLREGLDTEPRSIPITERHTDIIQVRVRQGRNRLLFRQDMMQTPSGFAVHICAQGAPGDHTRYEARQAAARALARKREAEAGPVGWRGDGTGYVSGALGTPAAWDLASGTNVGWRTPLRSSNCGVIAVGDRLFTAEEPFTLVCLDQATGAVRWRRDADPLELSHPDVWRKAEVARQELYALDVEADALRAQLIRAKDDATQRKLWGLEATISTRTKAVAEVYGKLLTYTRNAGYIGMSFPTPVSDGTHVWVKFGSQVLACYDMAGNRRWMIDTGARSGFHVSSPLLVGGKVIIELPVGKAETSIPETQVDDDEPGGIDIPKTERLAAYDAATGKLLWTSAPYYGNGSKYRSTTTPVVMTLTDGRDTMDVLVTYTGAVVRADDGKVLLPTLGLSHAFGSPVARGDRLYWYQVNYGGHSGHYGEMALFRLVMQSRDQVGAVIEWDRFTNVYFHGGFTMGPYAFDHPYGLTGYRTASGRLHAFSRQDGDVLGVVEPVFAYPMGEDYMPPLLVGDRLYLGNTGRSDRNKFVTWQNGMRKDPSEYLPSQPVGMTTVRAMAGQSVVLARNVLDGLTGAPTAAGNRLFVRTPGEMVCLAYTPGGMAYERDVLRRTALAQLPTDEPREAPAVDIAPAARGTAEGTPLTPGEPVIAWYFAGPVAREDADAARPLAEKALQAGQRGFTWKGEHVPVNYWAKLGGYPSPHLADSWAFGYRLDLLKPVAKPAGTTLFWCALLENDRERTVRLDAPTPGITIRIAGQTVAHGQRLHFVRGRYPVLVEVPATEAMAAERPTLALRFWDSPTVAEEHGAWASMRKTFADVLK